MLYDNSNPLQKANFLARANLLAERGEVVELRSKKQRSLNQNSYLFVLLGYFGSQYGESAEYIKEEYFKRLVNPQFFVLGTKYDKFRGVERTICRSTTDLTVEEMSICIDRFRNWSSKEAGIYLPTAEEGALLRLCEVEISRVQNNV